ncbi:MAG TPA: lytic transglycosylase domain-containing protein [Fimbriimonadaceae bacterium]|nr:lytic transglycosylase domain-containing protein [Fimbriimonadaceae bacterium]
MKPLQPLGPQQMLARLQELQAQFPTRTADQPFPSISQPAELQGEITPSGSFAPVNPFVADPALKTIVTPDELRPMITRVATENGLEPALLESLVEAESNFNPSAISSKRAIGLTQLMPDTAKELGVADPFDPAQNLQGGAKYLAGLLKRFGNDQEKAIAAYNAGPGAVERFGGIPPYRETQSYVQKVLSLYRSKKAS